jgi:hypothetical protein
MRTPWRSVADLVSRNPKVNTRQDHPAATRESLALGHQPSTTEAHPEPAEQSVEAASKEKADAVRPSSDASHEPGQISEDASATVEEERSVASADSNDTEPINPSTEIKEIVAAEAETSTANALAKPVAVLERKRRKPIRPIVEQPAPLIQAEDNASAVQKSLINEMADLDAEVQALRRQLGEKLCAQNVQLLKMLTRFDAK